MNLFKRCYRKVFTGIKNPSETFNAFEEWLKNPTPSLPFVMETTGGETIIFDHGGEDGHIQHPVAVEYLVRTSRRPVIISCFPKRAASKNVNVAQFFALRDCNTELLASMEVIAKDTSKAKGFLKIEGVKGE